MSPLETNIYHLALLVLIVLTIKFVPEAAIYVVPALASGNALLASPLVSQNKPQE
jgi:hypothetical protein